MNTKKEIRDIIAEHSAELAKGTRGYYSIDRKIWLTDKDYVRVYIFGNRLDIGLHLDNSDVRVLGVSGDTGDFDSAWRKFRYFYKQYMAKAKELGRDDGFVTKLKEVYSLL